MLLDNFSGKKVLVTGQTGFKGTWLCSWLLELGAEVVGIALDPATEPSHFSSIHLSSRMKDLRIDIRDRASVEDAIVSVQPDFVFHLAAQALVRRSYDEPIESWQINVLGTLHVLEALRKLDKPCAAVIVTSDKCYDNTEWVWGYRETDAMGGPDPYSASKGAAELAIRSYIKSYFSKKTSKVRIASARAGNVIGGGDWAADRIIPDCIRAIQSDTPIKLRNPNATRPWQHVLEPINGYLALGAKLYNDPEAFKGSWNFGPSTSQIRTVEEVANSIVQYIGKGIVEIEFSDQKQHEANLLQLNCDKSHQLLGWSPMWGVEKTF